MSRGRRRFVVGALGAAVGGATGARPRVASGAQGPSVVVRSDRRQVRVGEDFLVEVEVRTDDRRDAQSPGDPVMPAEPGLDYTFRSSSMSRSMTYRNGVMSSETTRTFSYAVRATRPGTYELLVSVEAAGRAIFATQVPVVVATGAALEDEAASGAPGPTGGAAREGTPPGAAPPAQTASESVFARVVTSAERIFVGEPIVAQWEVWQRVTASIEIESLPDFRDFFSVELPALDPEDRFVGGRQWRVHPAVRRVLFPQRAGTLSVGGGVLQVQPASGFGLFRRPTGRAFTVQGTPAVIEVRPLPAEGRPPHFSPNNVGRYTISSEIDRARVRAGDAFTVTYVIEGAGNLESVDPGEFAAPDGGRTYPPTDTVNTQIVGERVQGTRTIEILVVAERAGNLVIPAHSMAYFDPDTESYQVARTSPLTIEVTAPMDAAGTGTGPIAQPPPGTDAGAQDVDAGGAETSEGVLLPLREEDRLSRGVPSAGGMSRSRFGLAWGGIAGVGLSIWGARRVVERLRPSSEVARRRQMVGEFRDGMQRAADLLDTGDSEFYGELGRVLRAATVARAGPDAEGLTRDRLVDELARSGAEASACEYVRETLERCDAARFGGGEDVDDRRARLERVRVLLGTWRML